MIAFAENESRFWQAIAEAIMFRYSFLLIFHDDEERSGFLTGLSQTGPLGRHAAAIVMDHSKIAPSCPENTTYFVNLEAALTPIFTKPKWLRQGDPR